jgi:hypothetical protein
MSFIAVTYGYNQFSIFNTSVTTLSLIDNIISISLDEISQMLENRSKTIKQEIESYNIELDLISKKLKVLEADKIKEEELQKNLGQSSKDKKNAQNSSSKQNKNIQIEFNNPLMIITDELKNNETKRQNTLTFIEKMNSKLSMLIENKTKYEKIDRNELKIDLVDGSGDRMNMNSNSEFYANTYLIDKQCYELHKIFHSIDNLI